MNYTIIFYVFKTYIFIYININTQKINYKVNTQNLQKKKFNQLNELKKSVSIVFTQLGQLSIRKQKQLQQIETQETLDTKTSRVVFFSNKNFLKGLNEKYGDGNYDPNIVEFTPVETE